MEGAKKRILGVFEAFFDLYTPQKRRKHDTSLDFAAFLRQRKFFRLRHLLRHLLRQNFAQMVPQKRRRLWCRKNAAKFNEVLCLRRFCGTLSGKKLKNHKIRLLCRWGTAWKYLGIYFAMT